jgi:hypothetical protein
MPRIASFEDFANVVGGWLPFALRRSRDDNREVHWEGEPAVTGGVARAILVEHGDSVLLEFQNALGAAAGPPPQTFAADGSSVSDVVNTIREAFGFDPLGD